MLNLRVVFLLVLSLGAWTGEAKIDERAKANIHLGSIGADQPTIDYIILVLQNLEGIAKNGIPAKNISAFDPADIGGVHYPYLGSNYDVVTDGSADLTNLVHSGFSDVELIDFSFEILTLSGQLQVLTPLVTVAGSYDASGTVGGEAVTASGDITISSVDTVVNSTLNIGYNGTALVVMDLALELTVGEVSVTFTNQVGSLDLAVALEQDILDFMDQLETYKQNKVESLRLTLLNLLNEILALVVPEGQLASDMRSAMSSVVQRLAIRMGLPHLH